MLTRSTITPCGPITEQTLAFDEGAVARLEEAREQASAGVRQLRNEVDRLSHEVSGKSSRDQGLPGVA